MFRLGRLKQTEQRTKWRFPAVLGCERVKKDADQKSSDEANTVVSTFSAHRRIL
jgi:hypothetical protein